MTIAVYIIVHTNLLNFVYVVSTMSSSFEYSLVENSTDFLNTPSSLSPFLSVLFSTDSIQTWFDTTHTLFLPFMDFQFFFFLNSLKTNYFVINFSFHIFSALFSIHKYHWKLSLSNKIQIQQFKKWIFALFNTLFWTTDDKKSTATTYNSNVSIQNVSKIIQKSRDL